MRKRLGDLEMKRLKMIIVLLLSLTLTGCIQKYTVTDEKSDAYAEYMAGLLLKYDKGYEQSLIPEQELTEGDQTDTVAEGNTPTPVPEGTTDTTGDNTAQSDSAASNEASLTEVVGLEGFEVKYTGYKLADTYPEDTDAAGFTLTPRQGYQLLVTEFSVKNTSGKKKELNLIDTNITYQLDINVGTVYKPLLTLLQNDLQYIDITIDKGKSENVLLVFEVSKDTDMSNVNLIVSNNDKSNIIGIK